MSDRAAMIKSWGRAAVDWPVRLFFPPTCLGCRRHVAAPGSLCPACWPKLRSIEKPWCEILGTPFSHDMGEGAVSPAALADPPPFARARSAVIYDGVARDLVQGLKFRDRTEYAPWMARWMMRAGRELLADADMLTCVPLHRRRFLARTFNQSAELARALGDLSGLAFDPGLVVRTRSTRQQVGLRQKEREDNVRNAFAAPEEARIRLAGRRVLLVDDVYTTGATVIAVTRALRRGGAAKVDVLTFARVAPGDFRVDEAVTI